MRGSILDGHVSMMEEEDKTIEKADTETDMQPVGRSRTL